MGRPLTTPYAAILGDESVRDSFQLIAAGLCGLVACGPAAVQIVHDDLLLPVAVADSAGEVEPDSVAAPWPCEQVDRRLRTSVDGAPDEGIHFWPRARLTAGAPPIRVPKPSPCEPAGIVEPGLLVAAVRGTGGTLRGALMVECDCAPDPARHRVLEQYLARAARTVLTALERREFSERLRLADAARRIVRDAAGGVSLDEVMRQTAGDLVRCFGLIGVRARVYGPGMMMGQTTYAGPWPLDPPWLDTMTDEFAALSWRQQRVAVASTDHEDPRDPPDMDRLRDYLRRSGFSSSALVPLGAGPECFGSLTLVRAAGAPAWTGVEAAAAFEIGLDLGRVLFNSRAFDRERSLVGRLQAVDAYKNRLIATVSHELRNPLAAIRGNLELLSDAALEPSARRAVDVAERCADRMARVVDDLLHLARTLDERTPVCTERVDLAAVAYDATELLEDEARRRGVPVRLELAEQPALVLGDLDLLGQVVLNLLSNAIKYSPAGHLVTLGVAADQDEVVLTVTDRGIGISPDDRSRLFTEFFRSADPAVHAQPGTGLGLAIVDRLVRRHGGRVEVDSDLGVGSTFRVSLPAAPRDELVLSDELSRELGDELGDEA